MAAVAVVTDSAACVPPDLVCRYDIHIVPFRLVLDGRVMQDGVEVRPPEFHRWLRSSSQPPSTSQPPVGQFVDVYRQLARQGKDIISIHIPREISGTVDAARLAASMVPEASIAVIDSRTATIAEGFVALAAARAAHAGASLGEVVAAAERAIANVDLFACVPLATVASLQRTGRSGQAEALLEAPLNITPVLRLQNGRVAIAGVARNRQRGIAKMLTLVRRKAGNNLVRLATFHASDQEEANKVAERLLPSLRATEFYITELTPVMAVHTGPGVIGVALEVVDKE